MPTNIELAISAVLYRHKELTVHNVLVDYLRIIGYIEPGQKEATVPHDAVVAFEHALDKEPLLRRRCPSPDASLCTRMYTKEITALRKEYWKEKLGSSSPVRCTCPTCGCTVAYEKDPEVAEDDDDVLAERRRVRRLKNGRRESGHGYAVGLEPHHGDRQSQDPPRRETSAGYDANKHTIGPVRPFYKCFHDVMEVSLFGVVGSVEWSLRNNEHRKSCIDRRLYPLIRLLFWEYE